MRASMVHKKWRFASLHLSDWLKMLPASKRTFCWLTYWLLLDAVCKNSDTAQMRYKKNFQYGLLIRCHLSSVLLSLRSNAHQDAVASTGPFRHRFNPSCSEGWQPHDRLKLRANPWRLSVWKHHRVCHFTVEKKWAKILVSNVSQSANPHWRKLNSPSKETEKKHVAYAADHTHSGIYGAICAHIWVALNP